MKFVVSAPLATPNHIAKMIMWDVEHYFKYKKKMCVHSVFFSVLPTAILWEQTAVSTASWPACFVNLSLCAIWWWLRPRAAPARQKPVAAAAAQTTWETTATAPVTWTVALWMRAVSPRTAWRSAWSAAESVSQHKSPDTCRPQPGQMLS